MSALSPGYQEIRPRVRHVAVPRAMTLREAISIAGTLLTQSFAEILNETIYFLHRRIALDGVCAVRNHPYVSRNVPERWNDTVKRGAIWPARAISEIEPDPQERTIFGDGDILHSYRQGRSVSARPAFGVLQHAPCPAFFCAQAFYPFFVRFTGFYRLSIAPSPTGGASPIQISIVTKFFDVFFFPTISAHSRLISDRLGLTNSFNPIAAYFSRRAVAAEKSAGFCTAFNTGFYGAWHAQT